MLCYFITITATIGFFSTGDLNSTGNYGLKDQALGIKH